MHNYRSTYLAKLQFFMSKQILVTYHYNRRLFLHFNHAMDHWLCTKIKERKGKHTEIHCRSCNVLIEPKFNQDT